MDYFWPVLIALCLLGFYLFKKENISIQHALQQLAPKYDANVKRGIINYSQLTFTHQNLTVQVSATPHENGAFTYVRINTNQFSEDCVYKIISKSMPIKYLETNNTLKKQKAGIDEIDKRFALRAKNFDYLVALFSSEVRDALSQLDNKYSIEVRYIKDKYAAGQHDKEAFRFDLHIDQVLTTEEEYEQLIQATLLLVDQMEKVKR